MIPRPLVALAAALATMLTASVAPAQADAVRTQDVEVLSVMHDVDALQMRLGAMAEAKGTTPEIRRFGKLLYRDYRVSDDDVSRLSGHWGFSYAPPSSPDRRAEDTWIEGQLREASGREFDRRFLAATRGVASGAATYLRDVEPHVSQPDLHTLTDRFVPLLEQHVTIAKQLEKKKP